MFCWENNSSTYSQRNFTQKDYWLNLIYLSEKLILIWNDTINNLCGTIQWNALIFNGTIASMIGLEGESHHNLVAGHNHPPCPLRHLLSQNCLTFFFYLNAWRHLRMSLKKFCQSFYIFLCSYFFKSSSYVNVKYLWRIPKTKIFNL